MKKILFVYDHKNPKHWMDGLWAALNLLEKDFEISKFNLSGPEAKDQLNIDEDSDFTLGWGAFGSKVDEFIQNVYEAYPNHKIGLCIAGNVNPPTDANNYNILFYETKWYRSQIDFHDNIWQAFGVNTDLFNAIDISTPVVWDYIGVGALANWKRWDRMTKKQGNRLVVGEYQKENEEESLAIAKNLLREGVMVSDSVHPFDLVNFYHWSRTLYIPADVTGGGERAILEARSCGLEVEIEDDNDKLRELLDCDIPSHHDYYKQLKKGIERCISA